MSKRTLFLSVIGLVLVIGACVHAAGKGKAQMQLNATVLHGGSAGPDWGAEPGAAWITDLDTLAKTLNRQDRFASPAGSPAVAHIDFTRDGLLLIWMGVKPTGGYGLALIPDGAYIRSGTAVVAVRWIEPSKDAMVTQAITRPYLMVRINQGDYRRIRVVDQDGRCRVELDNPASAF